MRKITNQIIIAEMETESMGVKASLQRAWEIGLWTDVVLVGGDHTEVGREIFKSFIDIQMMTVSVISNLGGSTSAGAGSKLSHAWQTPGREGGGGGKASAPRCTR